MDLTNDMEIGVIIHKNIYVRLGIVLLLHLMKVSGEVVKRQLIPSFIPIIPRDQIVHTGDTVLLKCQIRNLGPKSVSWRKISEDFPLTIGDMMYAPNPEMSVDFVRNGRITNNTLIIKRVKPSHSGTYECQISSANIYTYHVNLEVLNTRRYTEPSITLDGTLYPSPNQKLNLTCNSTGHDRSPDKIDWFHNGNLIAESKPRWRNRAVIVNYVPEVPGVSLISQLTIDKVGASDAGIYVCRSMIPSEGMTVKTTSVMVNVLNAEKDIKKREDGHTQDTSHKLSRQDSSKTVRLSSCFYLTLLGLLFQIVK